jgi:PKD repeat protein
MNGTRGKVLSSIATTMIIISTLSAFFIALVPVTSADPLIDVTATPTDPTAGVTTTYIINFTNNVPLTPSPPDRIIITFQAGFNASEAAVDGATKTQSGYDPTLTSANATVVTLHVTKEEKGNQSIVLSGIINTQTIGTANVNVKTQDSNKPYAIIEGPTDSDPFMIYAPAAPTATKLVFSTGYSQTLTTDSGSSAIVIQRQDVSSNPVSTGAPLITVTLSTGSAGDAFYSNAGCTTEITTIDIVAGASDTASFYYKDSVVGTSTLTGASAGLTSATTGFTINAAAPIATKLVFSSGAAQTLIAGVGSSAIVIQRQDASSNPVSTGAPLITVTLSTNSAGGAFYSNSGCTNLITSIGISAGASTTATFYYKGTVAGSPTLAGASVDLTSAATTFTVNAATVATLAIQTQPTYTVAGVVITPPIEIVAKDAFNNVVPGVSVVATKLNGTGVLSGTTAKSTNSSGVAIFNDFSINVVGTNKTLQFTTGTLRVNSTVFTISNTSVASLTIQVQPSNTVAGAIISPSIQIKAVDVYDNTISGLSIVATLQTGTGTLSGTKTRATNGTGIATFNDLSINLAGTDKTLRFTAGAMGVNSSVFTITAPSTPPSPPSHNDAPTANAGGPYTGVIGTPVQFDSSQSTTVSGTTISSYSWSFGDGMTSAEVNPRHTYTIAGTYTIQLTVTDNTGATDTASTTATISTIAPPAPSITITNQTLQDIKTAYNITLAQPFYASDTNGDGIVDVFTDPNTQLTTVSFTIINGNATFLLSTNNDTIPEFFWDTTTNTITPITHTPAPLTTPVIDTTKKTVLIEITVNKTGWIYLDITDIYPIDEYPQYTFTVKAGNRTISSDMIWRKDGRIYILDDPATTYDLIYRYTILPPTFSPLSGTTLITLKPTITITYSQQVYFMIAVLDGVESIINQFTTTNYTVFTYTPTTDLTEGIHTINLTVQDDQGRNTLASTTTYTVSLSKQPAIDIPWVIIIIIAIICIIIVLLIYLRNEGYF